MKNFVAFLRPHYKFITITFQIFWIVIFLLNRYSSSDGGGVPQFVYVNF